MRARDPRFATVLGKLGYSHTAEPTKGSKAQKRQTVAAVPASDLPELRKQYQEIVGKLPFNGWDAEMLRAKIAEAKASN